MQSIVPNGNTLYLCGEFTASGTTSAAGLAKMSGDGTETITAIASGGVSGGTCSAITAYSTTGFLAGGSFTTAVSNSATLNRIAYYHFATDALYPLRHTTGTGVNVAVNAINVRSGGAGEFYIGTSAGLGTVSSPLIAMGFLDLTTILAYTPSSGWARRQRLLLQAPEDEEEQEDAGAGAGDRGLQLVANSSSGEDTMFAPGLPPAVTTITRGSLRSSAGAEGVGGSDPSPQQGPTHDSSAAAASGGRRLLAIPTPTPSFTMFPSSSNTQTRTPTRSVSPTSSLSSTPSNTQTGSSSATGTSTATRSLTPSLTSTLSGTPTLTASSSVSPLGTGSMTGTLSPGALPSASSTSSPASWASLRPYDAAAVNASALLGHGLTFVVQRDVRGSSAVGNGGKDMGLGGIQPSFGLRFQTRAGDTGASTLGFVQDGDGSFDAGSWGEYLAPYNLSWGAALGWSVSFTYNADARRVVAVVGPSDGSRPVSAYTFEGIDLRRQLGCVDAEVACTANIGFTAATGSAAEGVYNTHRVFTFDYLNQRPTGTPTSTMSISQSSTLSPSLTRTPEPTPSITASSSITGSNTASATWTPSITASKTATQSVSSSATGTSSATASVTRSASQTPSSLPTSLVDPAAALASEDALSLGGSAAAGIAPRSYDWRHDGNLVSLVSAPDSDYQASTTSVSVAWEPFEDVGSGIASVAYCLGTAQFACDLVDWIPAPSVKSSVDYAVFEGLSIAPGTVLFATIAAVNNVGLVTMTSSDGMYVDSRPPQLGQVVDTGKYFLHPEAVEGAGTVLYMPPVDINCDEEGKGVGAAWGADTVAPAGVDYFEWSVGTAPNASDILPWVNIGNVLAIYNESLTPPAGTTYVTCVRAVGLNGLTSVTCSDGVEVLDGETAQDRMVCARPSTSSSAAAAASADEDSAQLYRHSMLAPPFDE